MNTFFHGSGFLGTHGALGADISLVLSVVAAVLLTVGWRLAAGRRYEAHRWVQTAAVCVNAVPVAVWMIRSLWLYVLPGLPGNLGRGSYALTTVHAVVGAIGVVMGVYLVIRANQLTASGRSLARYKTAMRIAYLVYIAGTVQGVVLYVVLYG